MTLQGIRELLEDPDFPKIFFDCRQDSDALFHQFGVLLRGVRDLQLMELLLRTHRVLSSDGVCRFVRAYHSSARVPPRDPRVASPGASPSARANVVLERRYCPRRASVPSSEG